MTGQKIVREKSQGLSAGELTACVRSEVEVGEESGMKSRMEVGRTGLQHGQMEPSGPDWNVVRWSHGSEP